MWQGQGHARPDVGRGGQDSTHHCASRAPRAHADAHAALRFTLTALTLPPPHVPSSSRSLLLTRPPRRAAQGPPDGVGPIPPGHIIFEEGRNLFHSAPCPEREQVATPRAPISYTPCFPPRTHLLQAMPPPDGVPAYQPTSPLALAPPATSPLSLASPAASLAAPPPPPSSSRHLARSSRHLRRRQLEIQLKDLPKDFGYNYLDTAATCDATITKVVNMIAGEGGEGGEGSGSRRLRRLGTAASVASSGPDAETEALVPIVKDVVSKYAGVSSKDLAITTDSTSHVLTSSLTRVLSAWPFSAPHMVPARSYSSALDVLTSACTPCVLQMSSKDQNNQTAMTDAMFAEAKTLVASGFVSLVSPCAVTYSRSDAHLNTFGLMEMQVRPHAWNGHAWKGHARGKGTRVERPTEPTTAPAPLPPPQALMHMVLESDKRTAEVFLRGVTNTEWDDGILMPPKPPPPLTAADSRSSSMAGMVADTFGLTFLSRFNSSSFGADVSALGVDVSARLKAIQTSGVGVLDVNQVPAVLLSPSLPPSPAFSRLLPPSLAFSRLLSTASLAFSRPLQRLLPPSLSANVPPRRFSYLSTLILSTLTLLPSLPL